MKFYLNSNQVAAALVGCTILLLSSSCTTSCVVTAFVVIIPSFPQEVFQSITLRRRNRSNRHYHPPLPLSMTRDGSSNTNDNNSEEEEDRSSDTSNNQQQPPLPRTDTNQHVIIDELSWRITKVRLEEANTQRFLKRKPIKLPYALSQKWIQHNYSPKTKEEFEQLVMDGDLKNVYISKRPEEYYGERGEWISWDHYLLGKCEEEEEEGSSAGDNGVGRLKRNGTESFLKWQ